ncbi:cilia- and flagella-associated protein 100-like [Osmerus mordax]|uniref:cilia- and flagella-associated protein 100-like n=1 Tax=Osmerus mordax TaxID=8014 RepID=UPI00350FC04F
MLASAEGKRTAFKRVSSVSDTSPVSERFREVRLPEIRNPFSLPAANSFLLSTQDRELRSQEREREQQKGVQDKLTFAGRIQASRAALRRELSLSQSDELPVAQTARAARESPDWRKASTHYHSDKDNMVSYIGKKKEMFLIRYGLEVKQQVIQQLLDVAEEEERRVVQAERTLDQDVSLFDVFLKENDRNSVQAIKTAEQATRNKLEKMSEIKTITSKMVAIKSHIFRSEETLREYEVYRKFLLRLSPPAWQQRQGGTRASDQDQEGRGADQDHTRPGRRRKEVQVPKMDEGKLAEYEEPGLYFTHPQQLLTLLSDLEQQNLTLVQNCIDTEETLERMRSVRDNTHRKMECETEQLSQQMEALTSSIQRERGRTSELQLRARLFCFGEFRAEDQDVLLERVGRKVEEAYRACMGETEASLSTLQMLTCIEGLLNNTMDNLEMIPPDRITLAEKTREKERRARLREEKVNEQKRQQENRLKRSLLRAEAHIQKQTGRKLMARSQPVSVEARQVEVEHTHLETESQLNFSS